MSRSTQYGRLVLSALYFCANVALAHAAEKNMWEERRAEARRMRTQEEALQGAAAPMGAEPVQLLAQLPKAAHVGLGLPQSASVGAGLSLDAAAGADPASDGGVQGLSWLSTL